MIFINHKSWTKCYKTLKDWVLKDEICKIKPQKTQKKGIYLMKNKEKKNNKKRIGKEVENGVCVFVKKKLFFFFVCCSVVVVVLYMK